MAASHAPRWTSLYKLEAGDVWRAVFELVRRHDWRAVHPDATLKLQPRERVLAQ